MDYYRLKKFAKQGDAQSQYYLGKMYLEGKEVDQDYTAAMKWLSIAAAQGNAQAKEVLKLLKE